MTKYNTTLTMKLICTFYLVLFPLFVLCKEKQVYIVNFEGHQGNKTQQEIEVIHHSYLSSVKETQEEAKASLIYSYKHIINGFAALLTPDEALKLTKLQNVMSVFEIDAIEYSLQTTRSWEFLGLKGLDDEEVHDWNQLSEENDLLQKAKYGKDIIVGIVDTGIWPESDSFVDKGMEPIDRQTWQGECQSGVDFDSSHCNEKIIGAKYYLNDFKQRYGELDPTEDVASPRDYDGHGTHLASIIAGRTVKGVAAIGGYAPGTASGGAPMARLAIYKTCWAQPKHKDRDACRPADVVAGIEAAVNDGVHVLSISLGRPTSSLFYQDEFVSFGTLHAVKKDIVVVCAAGNAGPELGTVSNMAPWVITVGASTVDRMFLATLTLGNNYEIMGQTITPYNLENMHPLVYARDVENPNVSDDKKGLCHDGSLSDEKVGGKIVFCPSYGVGLEKEAALEVKRAGGVGVVLGYLSEIGEEVALHAHLLPAISLSHLNTFKLYKYIKSSENSMAKIGTGRTELHKRPAPSVTRKTSRGPNTIDPYLLKPDLIAPGLNILAAWSNASSPTKLPADDRKVKYNIISGSSVAAPHVAAVASLLKAIHPTWSPAAIRSALMTTASTMNDQRKGITDYDGNIANPFALGSGHIMPTKAADPGLIYDASYIDYFIYLCNRGEEEFVRVVEKNYKCPETSTPSYNLNYPSLIVLDIKDTVTVQRTVTNVGSEHSVYSFRARVPQGISVEASPNILIFDDVGEKKDFTITITPNDNAKNLYKAQYVFGSYTWTDKNRHSVRSPMVISFEEVDIP